jgi:hypothetical protein
MDSGNRRAIVLVASFVSGACLHLGAAQGTGIAPDRGVAVNWDNVLTVSKDGGGQYATIQDAINAVSGSGETNSYLIAISPGVYNEQAVLNKDYVTLRGAGIDSTTISYNDTGGGAAYSGTLRVSGSNCQIQEIKIINTTASLAYPGPAVSDDEASPADVVFNRCWIRTEGKDSIWMGGNGDWTFKNCLIECSYDTITTYAGTWEFENCEIVQTHGAAFWLGDSANDISIRCAGCRFRWTSGGLNAYCLNYSNDSANLYLLECSQTNNSGVFPHLAHPASPMAITITVTPDAQFYPDVIPLVALRTVIINPACAQNWTAYK